MTILLMTLTLNNSTENYENISEELRVGLVLAPLASVVSLRLPPMLYLNLSCEIMKIFAMPDTPHDNDDEYLT